MNIVIINDFAHLYGGASSVAFDSARELARRGNAVVLLSAISPVDPSLQSAGVHVVCLGQKLAKESHSPVISAWKALWNRQAAAELERVLSDQDPTNTVVHLHNWTKGISPSVVPVAMRSGVGLVVTIHDYFLACPNGGFYNYSSNSICRLKPLSRECITSSCGPGSYSQKLWRISREGVQQSIGCLPSGVKHFICVSNFSKRIIEPYLPAAAKIHDIGNPVDIPLQTRVNVSTNKYFAMVGRLTPIKGPLLAALAAQNAKVELRFVGDGELRGEIEGNFPGVEITGWLSQSAAKEHLRGARALVFPSRWYEAQPLVIMEAAAMGVPAIVADTCAGRDSIVDGVTGALFRGGDANHLAEKLSLLSNDQVVSSFGAAAFNAYWENPSTLAKHVDRLEECYTQILECRR